MARLQVRITEYPEQITQSGRYTIQKREAPAGNPLRHGINNRRWKRQRPNKEPVCPILD